MAEEKRYKYYEDVMNVIVALKKEGAHEYSSEKTMVIELITLFPKAVKKYVEHTLSTTLDILNISIEDYTIKVIDYAITKWIESPIAEISKGSAVAFLKVLNGDYKVINVTDYDYNILYNFYRVLYNCTNEVLPEHLDPDYNEEGDEEYLKFLSVEDMVPEVADVNSDLNSGYDEYHFDLDMRNDIDIYNKFLEVIKDSMYPNALALTKLKGAIGNQIEFFCNQNRFTTFMNLPIYMTNILYDDLIKYALVSLYKEKDSIQLLLYGYASDIDLNKLCDAIWGSIKSVHTMITESFNTTHTFLNSLFEDKE